MGTRHLIVVIADGETRVAQYGQWDGYPSGQGVAVLEFLSSELNRAKLATAAPRCSWISEGDFKATWDAVIPGGIPASGLVSWEASEEWARRNPHLSRDAGADILRLVADSGGLALQDSREFAADSLFCEGAYVVDLDAGNFEVYKGFQEKPHDAGRFASMKPEKPGYWPVKLVATYRLDALPSKAAFLAELEPSDAEDAA